MSLLRSLSEASAMRVLSRSGLFEPHWYLATHTDVAGSSVDPLLHYVRFGAAEGRDPTPVFDTQLYRAQYPELDPGQINPLCHYLVVGERAGAWPNRLFDPAFVAQQLNGQTIRGSLLGHCLGLGAELFPTSHAFDPKSHLISYPLIAKAPINPLWHAASLARLAPSGSGYRGIRIDDRAGLEILATNDLAPVSGGRRGDLFHVTGDDPFILLGRADGQPIGPGHYRMGFPFDGPDDLLESAKCYFGSGSSFSEAESAKADFIRDGRQTVCADISLARPVDRLRLDPLDHCGDGAVVFGMGPISFQPLSRKAYYSRLLSRTSTGPQDTISLLGGLVSRSIAEGPSGAAAFLRQKQAERSHARPAVRNANADYQNWIARFDTITDADREAMAAMTGAFASTPVISIIMPAYNTPEALLCECIDSVLDQTYPHWELCIADDCSTKPHVRAVLERYQSRDARIKVVFRKENGHISKASNSALDIAGGEWVALLDHDDLLPPHALFCIAEAINRHPEAMMIYSDEDKISLDGVRHDPYFKSDWNYHLFLSHNMFSHLGAYKADLVRKVGGFRSGFEGAQDYDLALRCLENVERNAIYHIPHVLYHWRVMPGSTALSADEKPYAMLAGERAITGHLERRGINGSAELLGHGYILRLEGSSTRSKVTIVIPTRDGGDLLRKCIDSIFKMTEYKDYELIIIDNGSVCQKTIGYLTALRTHSNVEVIRDDRPFNYSALNNAAVRRAKGELILLLNDDVEVTEPGWLSEMVKFIELPEIGVVGARLWYPNGLLQHFGLILSTQHVAMNMFKGMPREHFGYFGRGALTQEVSAVTAACLLVRKSDYFEVGGLDERDLAVAYNDVDFCLKIGSLRKRIVVLPHVNCIHHESATRGHDATGEKKIRLQKEKSIMMDRWSSALGYDPYYNPNLTSVSDNFEIASSPRNSLPWRG